MRRFTTSIVILTLLASTTGAQVLDKRALLARQTWWDNRDFDWFAARIPMFESPHPAVDATCYYRWELVTKPVTYGSPETGYTFTEFIDRPFWSGHYGAITVHLATSSKRSAGWTPRYHRQFARYWFETLGAQPRSYSNGTGRPFGGLTRSSRHELSAAVAATHEAAIRRWIAEHWDPAHRLFRWDGLHDGMERTSTVANGDIDAGAEGFGRR